MKRHSGQRREPQTDCEQGMSTGVPEQVRTTPASVYRPGLRLTLAKDRNGLRANIIITVRDLIQLTVFFFITVAVQTVAARPLSDGRPLGVRRIITRCARITTAQPEHVNATRKRVARPKKRERSGTARRHKQRSYYLRPLDRTPTHTAQTSTRINGTPLARSCCWNRAPDGNRRVFDGRDRVPPPTDGRSRGNSGCPTERQRHLAARTCVLAGARARSVTDRRVATAGKLYRRAPPGREIVLKHFAERRARDVFCTSCPSGQVPTKHAET